MTDFVEAVVTLVPSDAGGRRSFVSPRDGSYRPFVGFADGGPLLRVRFIEGPPTLSPGDTGRVVLELETEDAPITSGEELGLYESAGVERSVVGLVTVARVWRRALAF